MQQDNQPKPFMDITPPRPSATSRPVIVSNTPASDPVIKKIAISDEVMPVQPSVIQPQEVTPEPSAQTGPQFTPLTSIQPVSPNIFNQPVPPATPFNSEPQVSAMTPPAEPLSPTPPAETPQFGSLQHKIDAHPLFSGSKDNPSKKTHGKVWKFGWLLAIIIVILAGIYAALDSGAINTNIKLPFHIFKQPAAVTSSIDTPTATTTTNPYAGWKTYTSTADTALSFKYPSDWTLTKKADFLGVDSVSLANSGGSTITWGSAGAGVGGECDSRDKITVNSVDAITEATGLYVVQWTETIHATASTTPTTHDQVGVVQYGPDGKTAPVIGTSTGCTYPIRFAAHNGKNAYSFGASGVYKSADLATIKLILGSLSY